MRQPSGLALLPAEAGARHVALGHLRAAAGAYRRLGGPAPSEPGALHDFRVALRRLRVGLVAYRPELSATVSRRSYARIRRMARTTRRTRDLEVQLEWLLAEVPTLPEGRRAGAAMIADALAVRMRMAWPTMRERLDSRYPQAERRLRRELEQLVISRRLDASPRAHTMALATGRLILDQTAVVAAALGRVHGCGDAEALHAARIAVKRLRYLMEPLAGDVAAPAEPLAHLAGLQDELGALHDMQMLDREVLAAIAALPPADSRSADLVVLRERLDGHLRDAFTALRRDSLARCTDRLEAVADTARALVELGSTAQRSRHLRPPSRPV